MKYNAQYKVTMTCHGGFLCKKSNLFPELAIRYRNAASKRWVKLGRSEIDLYTYRRFKNTYYKRFGEGLTDMMTLEVRSDYERLEIFMHILNMEFGGSVKNLVESIVREHVIMSGAEASERCDVNEIALSLESKDWQNTVICV